MMSSTKEPIRYGDLYGQVGSNVNFVEQIDGNNFALRTYESVEDEHFHVERCQQLQ
jgi:hypothetical protein